MAELDSLIRVRKHTVDQKQKVLAELYRQAENLDEQKSILEQQIQDERQNIQNMGVEMLNFFGAYAKAVKARLEEIVAAREILDARIRHAQEDMRIAFAEMKKVEIINERRKAEEKAKIAKKDSDTMDEIGVDGFRRQNEDN